MDETKLNFNVKSHRGRSSASPDWAVTMVDISTSPANGFAAMIPDRSSKTLVSCIEKIVRPHTHIFTDEWKGYASIPNINNYKHSKITHKYNFFDPVTGINTQQVESFNNKIKTDIKTQKEVLRSNRDVF